MNTVLIILLVLVVLIVAAVFWRFVKLRSSGYPVVMRTLPAADGRHWRHGVLIYSGTSARFYKVRSLWPESDVVLTRLATVIVDRRDITDQESRFLEDDLHVVRVGHREAEYEIALDSQGDTALVSWLESRPSERRVRTTDYRGR